MLCSIRGSSASETRFDLATEAENGLQVLAGLKVCFVRSCSRKIAWANALPMELGGNALRNRSLSLGLR
jgi:hypothetical protein